MRPKMRMPLAALLMIGGLGLAACSGEEKSGNAVPMNDLEVVDGTTTDAMTDLDGVQSEVPASALPSAGGNNSAASTAPDAPATNAARGDTEVLSDQ